MTNQFYVEDDEWEFENVISSAIPRVPTDAKNLINWIKDKLYEWKRDC